jgi:hypothetical protein
VNGVVRRYDCPMARILLPHWPHVSTPWHPSEGIGYLTMILLAYAALPPWRGYAAVCVRSPPCAAVGSGELKRPVDRYYAASKMAAD